MSNLQPSYKSMKTSHSFSMRSFLTLTGSLVVFAVGASTPAFAEEEAATSAPAGGEAAAVDNAPPPPAAPPPAAAPGSLEPAPLPEKPATPAAANAEEATITTIGIERLKASAFPGKTRGIKGGSLALTYHGLQWPYMPSPSGGSRFVLGISGWVWDDVSYSNFTASESNARKPQLDQKKAINQGRFVLRATPTWTSGDWFVQGQGEFVATTNQTIDRGEVGGADTDDLWLRIGMWNLGDVQVGRFEGWEVFHLGMGLDLNTFEREGAKDKDSAEFYGLTDMQYRSSAAGNLAFHLYPMDLLRFEFLGQAGNTGSQNSYGGRAVGIFDMGWVKLKAGTEYRKNKDMKKANSKASIVSKGIAVSAQFVLHPWVECGINFAEGYTDTWDATGQHNFGGSYDRRSYGAFLNARLYFQDLILGLGAINSTKRDLYTEAGNVDPNANHEYSHLQSFVALQYAIFQQFHIKLVWNYAKSEASMPVTFDTRKPKEEQDKFSKSNVKEQGIRVRFSYFF